MVRRFLSAAGRAAAILVSLVICVALLAAPAARVEAASARVSSTALAIQTADGKTHRFKVELAATPEERARGLMFRRTLAADSGMLFDFGRAEPVSMWMKNTLIPLDMLFIAGDGAVVNIAQRTVPGSLTPIPAARPVRFVLELPGGTSSRLGIKPGDKVQHALMGNAAN